AKKPGTNCCRAAEKSQQQTTSRTKQAGPGNRKYCFFADADVAAKSNKPAKFRNETTVERGNGLSQFAADKTAASPGEQVIPVTFQEQRVDCDLQTQAATQNRSEERRVGKECRRRWWK